jgi:tRNA (uracil-5-)-methyltransferase
MLGCRLQGLDMEALDLKTLLVDPPRAGLDSETLSLLRNFQSVVYISCNPSERRTPLAAQPCAVDAFCA